MVGTKIGGKKAEEIIKRYIKFKSKHNKIYAIYSKTKEEN